MLLNLHHLHQWTRKVVVARGKLPLLNSASFCSSVSTESPSLCPLCNTGSSKPFWTNAKSSRSYFSCPNCSLAFMAPSSRLDPKTERSRYLLHENDPSDIGYRTFLSKLSDPLVDALQRDVSSTTWTGKLQGLDYGCGPGPTLSLMLEEKGYEMSVYDPYFVPDESVLNSTYDFVTCTEAVEHFYNPRREFRRFSGLVRPGGYLGLMTSFMPALDSFSGWHYHKDPTHVCFYSPDSLRFVGRWLGFDVSFPANNVALFRKL